MITIEILDRLKVIKNVIVSVIFAKLIPLGIPRCNCNQRRFPQELLHFSRINSARDKKCNGNSNH